MQEEEKLVIDIFNFFGFKAEKIPESNEKSPDFIINNDNKKILVELKTKYDSEDFLEIRENELNHTDVYEYHDILKRSDRMSGLIRDAYKQLKIKKEKECADECYLFLLASEPYSHNKIQQFYNTVYGIKFVIPLGRSAPTARNCFYYTFNDFFRYKDIIDGAIISNGHILKFCVNTFSEAYKYIYKNKFVNSFQPGVVDPIKLEENNKVYLMDSTINRRNTDALNEYLEKKYKLEKITQGNFPSITIESKIDIDN